MRGRAACFEALREYCAAVSLVDCHDHSLECGPNYTDPVQVVVNGYFRSDMVSADTAGELGLITNAALPLAERWPALARVWERTCHTGYARVTRLVLQEFYGEPKLTLEALQRMQGKLLDLTERDTYDGILAKARIAIRLENVYPERRRVLDGTAQLAPRSRLVIPLPAFHNIRCAADVQKNAEGMGVTVTSLDEYLAVCRQVFEAYKTFGAVAFKDQSAYSRSIDYENPTRAAAEAVFNWFMEDPRRSAAYPDGVRPLDDFLFHEFLRMARDMDLPVQIHTGHMAGVRNEISKTNAVGLTKVVELHSDVRFDIFHANWPYSGELLYLCKNYPNITIDFCWANIIDPVYCQEMFKQALSSVPHGKIHGYGSDFGGSVDRAWAHAEIARDNIAIALSDMVELQYLDLDEAREVAYAWLFGNANDFFRLGLDCECVPEAKTVSD